MSRIEQIARIHYEGLVEEFKSVGLDANITYKHLKERWEEYDGFVRTFSEDGKVVGFITNDSEDSMIYIDPRGPSSGRSLQRSSLLQGLP